jgi:arabinosaccharide transport system substrate-binding protein
MDASGAEALITLDPAYWEILLRQRGSDIYDAEGNLRVESETSREVLAWLLELKESGLANEPPRGSIYDPPYLTQVLGGDQVLTVMSPDWFGLDYLKGIVPEMAGKWRAMPLPAWAGDLTKRRTSSYAGQGLLIYSGSQAVEPAWGFVRFVMGEPEPNVQRYLQNNSLSAFKPAWEDERLYQPDPYFDGQSLAALLVELAGDLPAQYPAPGRAQLLEAWRSRIWPQVVSGTLTPEEALSALSQAAQP